MIIIGVDFHHDQEIASVDTDTGEYQEKRLAHPKEAEEFYRSLSCVGRVVRVGMEASGHQRWFERLLEGLGVELRRGDAEVIRAKRGRKQKTDREDARHILKLLQKEGTGNCFSTRAKWRALRSAQSSTLKKGLTPPTLSERRCFNSLGRRMRKWSRSRWKTRCSRKTPPNIYNVIRKSISSMKCRCFFKSATY